MHIAFVDRRGAHAIWRLMDYIAKVLIDGGHQVSYVQMDDGQQRLALDAPSGVVCENIEVSPRRSVASIVAQRREFRKAFSEWIYHNKPDIVHTNFCVPGNWAREVAKNTVQAKVITTCHELYGSMNRLLRFGVRRTEKYADAIVYISKAVGNSYLPYFVPNEKGVDFHQPKHRLIYNGVDVEFIQRIVAGINQRERELSEKRCRLVSVGRLVPEKGHSLVVRVLPDLLRLFPDLEYHIYGEGPERANLDDLAMELQVRDRLHLHGWVDFAEAVKQMALASVVVLPSYHEGFGLALVESAVVKVPIVAADIAAFREISFFLRQQVSLFSHNDHMGLCDCIAKALRIRHLIEIYSRKPEFDSVTDFAIAAMTNKYLDLYHEVISSSL